MARVWGERDECGNSPQDLHVFDRHAEALSSSRPQDEAKRRFVVDRHQGVQARSGSLRRRSLPAGFLHAALKTADSKRSRKSRKCARRFGPLKRIGDMGTTRPTRYSWRGRRKSGGTVVALGAARRVAFFLSVAVVLASLTFVVMRASSGPTEDVNVSVLPVTAESSAGGAPPAAPLTAGTYSYDAVGSLVSAAATEDLSRQVRLVVDAAKGGTQRQVTQDGPLFADWQLRFTPEGIAVEGLVLDLPGFRREFSAQSPLLVVPNSPEVGARRTWVMSGVGDPATVSAIIAVARFEGVDVGGLNVPTVVLHTTFRLEGGIRADISETRWVARNGLVVRRYVEGYAATPDAPLRWDLRATLSSMEPS